MIGKIKAHITRPMERFGFDLTLYIENQDGSFNVGRFDKEIGHFVFEPHKPGAMIPKEARLHLSREEAEAIFYGFLDIFDPPEATATNQKLAAVESHLRDTKLLLSAVLPSALRKEAVSMKGTVVIQGDQIAGSKNG
jgi:hypothetical protein